MCWKRVRLRPRKWLFPSLLMGTWEDEGTRYFSRMINSPGIPTLILFISFIRNEAVRVLIYTAGPFISSTTLSHTRRGSIFSTFSLVSVDSLPSFRQWRELIALQIVAEYEWFPRCLLYELVLYKHSNMCHLHNWKSDGEVSALIKKMYRWNSKEKKIYNFSFKIDRF